MDIDKANRKLRLFIVGLVVLCLLEGAWIVVREVAWGQERQRINQSLSELGLAEEARHKEVMAKVTGLKEEAFDAKRRLEECRASQGQIRP